MTPLTTNNHDRDSAGLTYVYPVVSRRAGGVSVGINLNPNNACNWACVYCQVPGLTRGSAPAIDLAQLEAELSGFLGQARTPAWLAANAPEGARKLTDIAFSGNGEPTTAEGFDGIVERVLGVRASLGLDLKTVLITNGSQMHRPGVIGGLRSMADARGEVWFKIDAGTAAGRGKVNGTPIPSDRVAQNLGAAAAACPTKVQTCLFAVDGAPPADTELDAYLDLLRAAEEGGAGLAGVLLYGLARPSMQPDAERLSALPPGWLDAFAGRITAATGLAVSVHG